MKGGTVLRMKRENRSKDKKVIVRVACVLIGSVIVSVSALMINFDTFSWFTSNAKSEMSVTAATTKNIIETIEMVEEGGSCTGIRLVKNEELEGKPIIYFEIEGEAADYILHVNPAELIGDGEYIVPIEPNINFAQHLKLFLVPIWRWDANPIEGTIRVKYLNGFIDEEHEIQLTRDYLYERFWENIERQGVEFSRAGDVEDTREEVVKLITNIADFVSWEEESTTEDNTSRISIMSFNSEDSSISSDMYITPITRLVLSLEQEDIIEVIAPKLLSHLESLYDKIEELTAFLTEKLEEIAELTFKVEEQEVKILTLEEEKLVLDSKVAEMTTQNEELSQENLELNENILLLGGEVISLEEDNSKLEKKNDALSDENSSLSSSNSRLSGENAQLRSQVEELQAIIDGLMTSDDNDTTVPGEVYGSD